MEDNLSQQEIDCLKAIKEKIKESGPQLLQNALENGELPDDYLLRFLRTRAFDIDSALERVLKLHEARVLKYPEFFANIYPSHPSLKFGIDNGGIRKLKGKYPNGAAIFILRANVWSKPEKMNGDEVPQLSKLMGWESLRSKDEQLSGVVNIMDVSGFTYAHSKFFTRQALGKWADIFIKSSPVKIKDLHFVNVHPLFKATLYIVKMFLPKKIAARVHTHGRTDKGLLNEYISPSLLPESLGGDLSEDDALDWDFIKKLQSPEVEAYYRDFAKPSIDALSKST